MLKTTLVLLIGITIGWIVTSQLAPSVLMLETRIGGDNCPVNQDFTLSDNVSEDQANNLEPSIKQCISKTPVDKTDKRDLDPLVAKLLNSRAILPDELTFLNHWHDLADLEAYLESHALSASEMSRIKAKAEVYFNQKFVVALQDLFAAIHSARDTQEEDTIQAEVNALVDFIGEQFFKEPPTVNEEDFLQAMNLVHEKKPRLLSVILLMARHHLMMGNFELVENYIERIPQIEKNKDVTDFMKMNLEQTKARVKEDYNGIPIQRKDNHFYVNVTINDNIMLNLMIDTGASRTLVSQQVMRTMRRMSNKIEDLKMTHRVWTANGSTTVNLYKAESLSIKGFSLENPLIMTSNIKTEPNMHGLLGMDFLGEYQFRIDHEKNILYLSH